MSKENFRSLISGTKTILKLVSSISRSFIPLTILASILKALFPFINLIFSSLILDGLITGASYPTLMFYVLILAGMNLFVMVSRDVLNRILENKTESIDRTVKNMISRKCITMDYEQQESQEIMSLLKRADEGSNSHGGITSYCNTIARFITNILTIGYSLILMSALFIRADVEETTLMMKLLNSPFATLILMAIIIVILIINLSILRRINDIQYRFFDKNVELNRNFMYYITLADDHVIGKDIRIFAMDRLIMKELGTIIDETIPLMKEIGSKTGKYTGLSSVYNQIVILLSYVFIGTKALLNLISVGSIIRLVGAISSFNTSLSEIISDYSSISIQNRYLKNYVDFLNLPSVKYHGHLPVEKRDDNQYEIEFRNVSFHYPNNPEMILKNVSLKLKIGEKMAIVGPNGAGKTTFIKLLTRLYDPTEGEILLNGIDIRKYDYNEYLSIFAVVFQDFRLFSMDVAQNVAADTHYDENRIWKALEQSGIRERIERMEKGIHTGIYQKEENGVEISGGEAQKLAISRALYKDAPIVILDEPTSSLDPISEYEIYAKFDALVSGKTSIYISHRMSSCRFCDNIIVFDEGRITQSGSHEQLMKNEEGLYHRLWVAQAKYYHIEKPI